MPRILDNYTIFSPPPRIAPQRRGETGASARAVEMLASSELHVTAEEARRKVDRWLHQQVSMLISADPPTLMVGERTVWCVPAYISFPHVGRVGVVGTVSVDVESGEMKELARCQAEIERYLEEKVKPNLPPYKAHTLSANFIPKHIPQAPKLILPDDEEQEVSR